MEKAPLERLLIQVLKRSRCCLVFCKLDMCKTFISSVAGAQVEGHMYLGLVSFSFKSEPQNIARQEVIRYKKCLLKHFHQLASFA